MEHEVPRTFNPNTDHWLSVDCRRHRCDRCRIGSVPVEVGRIHGYTHVVQWFVTRGQLAAAGKEMTDAYFASQVIPGLMSPP
jgi:hypothetical protein